ncbi:MAG: NAD(P)-dependent oxidoreductase [Ectothiorhodospiraceae bacterium]|nr:NAD(P)-dependent oxidoreductase [Chromatiales bacterium]MCP5153805.1 NAD(P)-dependent oxidoreductase [Ectothiorhodospiraceae bacterium]
MAKAGETGTRPVVGLLNPGAMGSSVGAAMRANATVLWASAGRGERTVSRARDAGLEDAGTLAELVARSEVVVSVCPPEAALALAREVAAAGPRGVYVDANAVSPQTARAVGEVVTAAGASFVDGGIIGPPAHRPGTTRLYLCGADAPRVAALFAGSPMDARVIEGGPGAASALKMTYAAWTKGSDALILAIRALAAAEGIEDALVEEWNLSQTALPAKVERAAASQSPKAWRFVGEMEEIADTFANAGLPDGFHRGAADLYRRLAGFKDADPPSLEAAIRAIRG